jgi:hypothetical protein
MSLRRARARPPVALPARECWRGSARRRSGRVCPTGPKSGCLPLAAPRNTHRPRSSGSTSWLGCSRRPRGPSRPEPTLRTPRVADETLCDLRPLQHRDAACHRARGPDPELPQIRGANGLGGPGRARLPRHRRLRLRRGAPARLPASRRRRVDGSTSVQRHLGRRSFAPVARPRRDAQTPPDGSSATASSPSPCRTVSRLVIRWRNSRSRSRGWSTSCTSFHSRGQRSPVDARG